MDIRVLSTNSKVQIGPQSNIHSINATLITIEPDPSDLSYFDANETPIHP